MPAAVPLISTGISFIGSRFGNKGPGQQQRALVGAQGQLAGQAAALGAPNLGAASSYYNTMLRGDRASMAAATAGPRTAITDVYRGAERNLERSGVRGATRDVARANMARDRASQVSGLVAGVQPAAAEALSRIGASSMTATGNLYSQMLEGARADQTRADEQAKSLWGNIGKLIVDGYGAWKGRGGAGTSGTPATIPTNPHGYSN